MFLDIIVTFILTTGIIAFIYFVVALALGPDAEGPHYHGRWGIDRHANCPFCESKSRRHHG